MPTKPQPDQSAAAVRCLQRLAKLDPDGASRKNDIGFNGSDSARGHQLARLPLTHEQHYAEARRMIWTYRRQLDPADIAIVYRDFPTPSPIDLDDLGGEEQTPSKVEAVALVVQDSTNPVAVMQEFEIHSDGGFGEGDFDITDSAHELAVTSNEVKLTASAPRQSSLTEHPEVEGEIKLTDEQHAAVDRIIDWLVDPTGPQEFKLGGYAGTGKTTLIKRLLQILNSANKTYAPEEISFLRGKKPMIAAFTGKACNVLRRKGVPANTIHSTMYRPREVDARTREIEWVRVWVKDLPGNFWIVDEASMISTEIYKDMKEYGMKMLFVGDPGQLEPVGENPNLMRTPDITLQTIHRQALQSPIIKLATDIRHGFPLPPMGQVHTDLLVRDKNLNSLDLLGVTQVICAKNKTRTQINNVCRQALGRTAALEVGDKLIITKNNKDMGVFNGMIVFVDQIRIEDHRRWLINGHDEDDQPIFGLPIAKEPFSPTYDAKTARITKDLVIADYGYCITCHKSQGSEWEHVLVIDEWVPPHVWDMKRWRYTAFTRAAKKLTLCRDIKK